MPASPMAKSHGHYCYYKRANNQGDCKTSLRNTQRGNAMIDALITFLAVAEAGSFARVARTQGVAVSSVTRRIGWLETELKTRLFIRSSRRVMLTDAGALFLSRARHIVDELADAKESLSALSADLRGILTVTAPAAFGRRHVMPAVISFLKQYPQIEMDLHISDAVLDLGRRRVDVAI